MGRRRDHRHRLGLRLRRSLHRLRLIRAVIVCAWLLGAFSARAYVCPDDYVRENHGYFLGSSFGVTQVNRPVRIVTETGDCHTSYAIRAGRATLEIARSAAGAFTSASFAPSGRSAIAWAPPEPGVWFLRASGARLVVLAVDARASADAPSSSSFAPVGITLRLGAGVPPPSEPLVVLRAIVEGAAGWHVPMIPVRWPARARSARARVPPGRWEVFEGRRFDRATLDDRPAVRLPNLLLRRTRGVIDVRGAGVIELESPAG